MSDVPLREYMDARIDAVREELEQRGRVNQRALEKAEVALTIRLDGMNEFREQLQEERGQMARRVDLEAIEKRLYSMEAKSGGHDVSILRIDLSIGNTASKMWVIGVTVFVAFGFAVISFLASRTWTNWVVR